MQWLYRPMSWILEKTLGTSPVESFNTVACIFSNQSAPQHLKQLLRETTRSEMFSVMVGGFGTASIGVMVAYIGLGIPVNHLMAASIMSAPAALAVAKLMFPEKEHVKVKLTQQHIRTVEVDEDRSIFDAASSGGMAGLQMVGNLAATIITFASLFALGDAAVAWMLSMVDLGDTGLEDLLSYVMFPIAYLIGVDVDECQAFGRLLGRRLVLSELVAFRDLSMKVPPAAGESCIKGCLSDRSIVLATYALYGFANFGSLRIVMNALGKIAPDRKLEIYQQGGRAMFGGKKFNSCVKMGLDRRPSLTIGVLSLGGRNDFVVYYSLRRCDALRYQPRSRLTDTNRTFSSPFFPNNTTQHDTPVFYALITCVQYFSFLLSLHLRASPFCCYDLASALGRLLLCSASWPLDLCLRWVVHAAVSSVTLLGLFICGGTNILVSSAAGFSPASFLVAVADCSSDFAAVFEAAGAAAGAGAEGATIELLLAFDPNISAAEGSLLGLAAALPATCADCLFSAVSAPLCAVETAVCSSSLASSDDA